MMFFFFLFILRGETNDKFGDKHLSFCFGISNVTVAFCTRHVENAQ